jgi:putative glycosyltransferase
MNSSVLIISAVFPPEPIVSAKLSEDIANGLVEHDIKVVVLHPRATRPYGFKFNIIKKKAPLYEEVVLQTYVCPKSNVFGRLFESYSFGCKCRNYIQSHHLELACIYINSWPLFSQALIVKAASKYGIPCIIHVQDIYPESFINKMPSRLLATLFQKALLPIDKYILSHADYIFAISANMKEYLVKTRNIDSTKISIIENWQNEDEFIAYHNKLQTKKEKRPLTFMYLGNNGPVAGVEFLIHCFVKADIQGVRLVIAGSGSRKVACMELAKIHSNIEIEFWDVPDGKVPEVQDQADVMLLPVKKGAAMSSIPSKLPAYMFSKKAILGSLDIESDTARAILDAGCGIVVRPENEEELVLAWKEMAQWSKDTMEQKGNNGFIYAMNRFSKKHNLPIITNIIKEICIK